ncbi:MAG: hypothetical protein Q8M29_17895 [Bacteroidota bacterium]|nr:hypothetical protein [Bacteroidota bacterium]
MKWTKVIALLTLVNLSFIGKTQNLKDSCLSVPLTGLHLSGQLAAGDLKTRFGNTMSVGIPFMWKTKKNWVIGIEGSYFFGKTVNENSLSTIQTAEGTITANDGAPGRLRINERGLNLYVTGGKILPFWNPNKNCGPLVSVGVGYMQHKINIYDIGKNLPQIKGDLRKGYDRLTGGVAFTQFVGYMYLSKNRLTNFYAGFEFNEGFTKGLRGVQYDTMASDGAKRTDIQIGFRVGWVLPLYRRVKDYYYN